MFGIISMILGAVVKPIFEFLNKRVDAELQTHVVNTKALENLGGKTLDGLSKADDIMGRRYEKEGNFGPAVFCMLMILAPFVWHEWQVVLDSSRFHPSFDWLWGFIPYPTVAEHVIGSWKVPGIGAPGADGQSAWDKTEQAIFQSFFIGASTAVAGVAIIKAIKR